MDLNSSTPMEGSTRADLITTANVADRDSDSGKDARGWSIDSDQCAFGPS